MKRKIVGLIILILIPILLFGCGNGESKKEKLNINFSYRDGVPGLTAVKLIKDNPTIDKNIDINYEMLGSPDL